MDSVTIIISFALLVLALLPFAFTGRKYRKQKKQMVGTLRTLAEQNGVELSEYEICCNFGIGMDKDSRYLFVARAAGDEISGKSAALWEMVRCKMNTLGRMTEEGEKVTDRIELVLHPVAASQSSVVMELYNTNSDSLTLKGELQVAARWEQIVANAIKNSRKPVRNVTVLKQPILA